MKLAQDILKIVSLMMNKDEALKYMWTAICFADIWGGWWFLHEKCTIQDWWTLPSLMTLLAIFMLASFKAIEKVVK